MSTHNRPSKPIKYIHWVYQDVLVRRLSRMAMGKGFNQELLAIASPQVLQRQAIAMLLGLHGARSEEVCQLTMDDFDPTQRVDDNGIRFYGQIDIRTIKGGVDRTVQLGPGNARVLLEWRKQAPRPHGNEPPWLLFSRSGGRLRGSHLLDYCREITRVLIKRPHKFHALRHTFAMRLLHQTNSITHVAGALGHASTKNTEVYTRAYGLLPPEFLETVPRSPAAPDLRRDSQAGRKRTNVRANLHKNTQIPPFQLRLFDGTAS